MRKRLATACLGVLLTLGGCGPASSPEAPAPTPSTTGAQGASPSAPAPSPIASEPPDSAVLEQVLAYGEAGNRNLEGFLAMPADAAEPLPGVLVIHEWWGLNDNIRAVTRRLAGEGYIALAVDLYGGATAATPEQAAALAGKVAEAPDAARDNLRQAYEYLDKYAFSPTVGVVGWCFGGGWALQAALMLPRELDAAVMYYGPVVSGRAELEGLAVPLLGLFAGNDQTIPVRDVQAFRSALQGLGKDAEVRIYSNVAHAFANPSGGAYDPVAADDAWQRTLEFLDARLRSPVGP